MNEFPIYYRSSNQDFTLLHGDSRELLKQFEFKFDMIFADPPYFLSNGGQTISNGRKACVDKGDWDKGGTPEQIYEFNNAKNGRYPPSQNGHIRSLLRLSCRMAMQM